MKTKSKRYSQHSAYTMIELIFVIVILGILAAVGIPRLAASREDARASVLIDTFKNVSHTIQIQMLSSRITPSIHTLYGANGRHGNILVNSDTSLVITDGITNCAQIDVNATHVIISAISTVSICNRFDSVVDEDINVLNLAVVR